MADSQVLVSDQNVPWPPAKQDKYYLVYGASSSVGLFALPLAKAMGYKTIAVCSPRSFDLVKSYGADEVVDYHQGIEAAGAEIRKLAGGKGVDIGLDTISDGDSVKISQAGFGEKGGRLNLILPAPKDKAGLREDVELSNTMMYTLFGKVSDRLFTLPYQSCFG
jgi:NADPH:quinone reductase-like Zn-dependent oxidoreductase